MSSKPNPVRLMLYGLLVSSAAIAQAQAAPPSPPVLFAGPVIPGVCVLDQQAIFNRTKVGIFANSRYKQMHDGAQSAVNADEAKIAADAKALPGLKLPQAQLQQRQQDLAKRFADLRTRAAKESQDLDATRLGVVTKIAAAAQPIVGQVYAARKCGLLLAKGPVLAGNPGMEITAAVISVLDAKITTIPRDQKVASADKR